MMDTGDDRMDDGSSVETDARGIFRKLLPSDEPQSVISGAMNSDVYSMNYPKRGKCLIFNHKNFEPHMNMNIRNGTDADASRLYCRFRELGFEVQLFNDLCTKEIEKELLKVSREDHSGNSCFVCCVLSHGEYGILYGADGKYQTERLFAPFRGDVCTSLAGKPKMFFIQACQGDRLDSGVRVSSKQSTDASDQQAFRVPTHADFLIVYSTVPGFYSWRNTTNGSWFMQSLVSELTAENLRTMDVLSILTNVNRKVAFDFESYTPNDKSMHLKKQVPFVTHTLLRMIRLTQNGS